MYELVPINQRSDLDRLNELLDEFYDAESVIKQLKAKLNSRCRNIVVESGYVDKDYRSTYYHFYAKKGYRYDSSCVRLHFFDDRVRLINGCELASNNPSEPLSVGYFGFIVLRPTRMQTVGRTVLSPNVMEGFRGHVITSRHKAHLLGKKLTVDGFPCMAQHTDVSVCAHVACWAILRHYSERFSAYRELLTYDVTRLAHEFDPGGLLPSLGLDISHAERVFASAGTYPLVVARESRSRDLFERQLLAYVESGFPVFAAMPDKEHAIAVIGHGPWNSSPPRPDGLLFAQDLTSSWIGIDDNFLPYVAIDRKPGSCGYGIHDIEAFIVPLPEKLYYPADAVDQLSKLIARGDYLGFVHDALDRIVVRYFVTTAAAYRRFLDNARAKLAPELLHIAMHLTIPQFLWIIELSSLSQWEQGQVATRVVLDATASSNETNPLFIMHNARQAYVQDRGGSRDAGFMDLSTPAGASLSRMPGNLSQAYH